jgi:hypothetical protein
MAVNYDFTCFYEELRNVIRDAYEIPDTSPILESGNEPFEIDESKYALPWGIIEMDGEAQPSEGPALLDVTTQINVYLWKIVKKPLKDTPDTVINMNELMREAISCMAETVYSDISLNGTVGDTVPLGFNWKGDDRDWPFIPTEGQSLAACYVGFQFFLRETNATKVQRGVA